ncbi:hypothetical protein WQO_12150 [Streptomyces globisporus C-1027]|uniref:Uncharacterized protein n=1 Tax=Streptomyces globisporus C-1027 TaxID=1172567 RepID=A0A0U3LWR7_STRGL|nr:hypothetical protein WQO_12150 [Streptomyces globisporus C-1027]
MCTIADTAHRSLFLWWLIGTTAQLERRPLIDDEPDVLFMPATRQAAQPDPNWLPGTRLHLGEWPYRSSSWIAPWFVDTLNASSVRDRKILQGLAAQQLAFRPRDV